MAPPKRGDRAQSSHKSLNTPRVQAPTHSWLCAWSVKRGLPLIAIEIMLGIVQGMLFKCLQ